MTKRFIVITAVMAMLVLGFVAPVMSADKVLDAKISDMVIRLDKNQNEYVRFIIQESRTTQGVSYTVGVPVMAFGSTVTQAKTLNTGDNLKCVAMEREYQGRKSYTILAWLK